MRSGFDTPEKQERLRSYLSQMEASEAMYSGWASEGGERADYYLREAARCRDSIEWWSQFLADENENQEAA